MRISSLFEVALAQLGYIATWTMTGRYQPTRRAHSAHQTLIPFQNFRTSDGWIVVACPKEALWRRLCEAIDRPDWAEDKRFATFADRSANRSTLVPLLDDVFSRRTTDDWLEILERAMVPCGRVNDVPDALADKQARGAWRDLRDPSSSSRHGRACRNPVAVQRLDRAPERGPFSR